MMHSGEALDPNAFPSNGAITSAFLRLGKRDFRCAGQYIQALPYGRNCFNTLAARSQVPLTLKKTGVILP
jgi:hypothetical protein